MKRMNQVLDGQSDPEDLQRLYEGEEAANLPLAEDVAAPTPQRVAGSLAR
jgi:hypothetical protein